MVKSAEAKAPYINIGHLTKRDIGQRVDGKGILIAHEFQYTNPVTNNKTGCVFNVFATPKDLQFLDNNTTTKVEKFPRSMVAVGLLKNVCGHDGIIVPSDSHVCAFARYSPDFLNNWHIPTVELAQEMAAAKRKFNLIGTFAEAGNPSRPTRYWTLSGSFDHLNLRAVVDMENGLVSYCDDSTLNFSCRPVRAELAPRK